MMEYNIDILVAGCNTNCRHCYVDGGPGKRMTAEDFEICITRLRPVFQHYGKRISFTLDNEPYNHPNFPQMIDRIRQHCWDQYFHHGSTTGIAFNHRSDKETIWKKQQEYGIAYASITLHGGEKNHNFMTQNTAAFAEAMDYICFVKAHGGKLYLSLMLSKLLIDDRDKISEVLREVRPDEVYFAIPNGAPLQRLQAYQEYRPSYRDCLQLEGCLSEWGLDESTLMERFAQDNGVSLLKKLKTQGRFDLTQPGQCYLSIHPDLKLYIGNSGVETFLVGDLRTLSVDEMIAAMEAAPANFNFFPACFEDVPEFDAFIDAVERSGPDDLVYPDMDSFISYHLVRNHLARTLVL